MEEKMKKGIERIIDSNRKEHNYGTRKSALAKAMGTDEGDYNFGQTMGVNEYKISASAGTGKKGTKKRANQIRKTKGAADAEGYRYGRTEEGATMSEQQRAYNIARNNSSKTKKKTKKKKC